MRNQQEWELRVTTPANPGVDTVIIHIKHLKRSNGVVMGCFYYACRHPASAGCFLLGGGLNASIFGVYIRPEAIAIRVDSV